MGRRDKNRSQDEMAWFPARDSENAVGLPCIASHSLILVAPSSALASPTRRRLFLRPVPRRQLLRLHRYARAARIVPSTKLEKGGRERHTERGGDRDREEGERGGETGLRE